MEKSPPFPEKGRPRTFDVTDVLERAMEVFWRKGYDAASISDLTAAMGISPPSIYAAFGNKETLFLRVIQHYGDGPASYSKRALEAPTARAVASKRLHGAVEAMCDKSRPAGCLAVQAAMKCGDPGSVIGKTLREFFEAGHAAFVERFKRAKREGDLPASADPIALSRFLNAVAHGIAVQAAAGVPRRELKAIAEQALGQFPEESPKTSII